MLTASSLLRQQGPDDRKGVAGGEPFGRAGELAADLDGRLDRGPVRHRGGEGRAHIRAVADEARRPEPHVGVGVLERLQCGRPVQPADQVQRDDFVDLVGGLLDEEERPANAGEFPGCSRNFLVLQNVRVTFPQAFARSPAKPSLFRSPCECRRARPDHARLDGHSKISKHGEQRRRRTRCQSPGAIISAVPEFPPLAHVVGDDE